MFGSKINLHSASWLDVIFDQKNKGYGAYALRRQSDANTAKSLLYAGTFFTLLFLSPKIASLIIGDTPVEQTPRQIEVVIADPPPVNPELPEPVAVEPPAPLHDQIEFPPPRVVADKLVPNVDPPQIDELKTADPGQKTIAGDPTAEIVIVAPAGEGPKQSTAAIVDDTRVYEMRTLEVQPSFPGGIEKFYAYLSKSLKYPPMAAEANIAGKVIVSFVVEKDGTLTDFHVLRSLGGGTDEEAIRVLKASPAWIPGIQNGRKVRVKYNIPISFTRAQ